MSQEQLDHALALLFDQFVSFAHNSVVFIDCLYDTAAFRGLSAAKLIIFFLNNLLARVKCDNV